jgi:hypothetical protein
MANEESVDEAMNASDRVMIGAVCAECQEPYIMIFRTSWSRGETSYCSKACTKRAYRRRKKTGSPGNCPVGCGNTLMRPNAVVCGKCWLTAARMCKGKRRLSQARAMEVQETRDRLAVWCRCCGWWHNTSHPVEDETDLVYQVGRILEVMRQKRGKIWVDELVESWGPDSSDRNAWKYPES